MFNRICLRLRAFRTGLFVVVVFLISCTSQNLSLEREEQFLSIFPPQKVKYYDVPPVTVEVSYSAQELRLIDILYLRIRITYPIDKEVIASYIEKNIYSPFVLYKQPRNNISFNSQTNMWTYEVLYSFEPRMIGEFIWDTQDFYLTSKTSSSSKQVISIPFEKIVVSKTTVKRETTIKNIQKSISLPYNYFPLLATIIILCIIAISFILLVKLFRTSTGVNNDKDVIHYRKWALNELYKLKQQQIEKKHEIQKFHLILNYIIRTFLEKHLNLRVQKKTTEEFLENFLTLQILTQAQKNILEEYLALSDLVKFADFTPKKDITFNFYHKVENFINSFT